MSIKKLFKYLLSIPKTIYFNFKYFNFFTAIKLPVFISYNTVLSTTKGRIQINSEVKAAMIRIGFGDVGIFDKRKSRTILQINGDIIFKNQAFIGHGSRISVNKNGTLILGDNFRISAESSIVCNKKIVFGKGCLLSWDILIMDTDFHKIILNNKINNIDKEIIVGDHVWIGCRTVILKGVSIPNNIVISANSHIYKSFNEQNTIIAGNPPKIIKENIKWEE